jgi:type IV pilus assembly protein PilP
MNRQRPPFVAFILVGIMSVMGAFLIALKFLHKTHAQESQAVESEVNAAEEAAAKAPVTVLPGGANAAGAGENVPGGRPQAGQGAPPPRPPPQQMQANPAASGATPGATAGAPPAGANPGTPGAAGAPGTAPGTALSAPPRPGGSELSELEGFLEPFIYDVVNRRDPFMAWAEFVPNDVATPTRPLSPAQRFDLDQLRLVGIMWDIKDPKAMFMDPEQDVIVLGRDEGIGNRNGYIASIREGEVVVVEAIRKRGDVIYKTRVLRIER